MAHSVEFYYRVAMAFLAGWEADRKKRKRASPNTAASATGVAPTAKGRLKTAKDAPSAEGADGASVDGSG